MFPVKGRYRSTYPVRIGSVTLPLTVLPHGSRLKPSNLGNLVDMTTQTARRELRKVYLRENPDGALSRKQRIVREAFEIMRQAEVDA